MKKTILFLLISLIGNLAIAQSPAILGFYNKYKDNKTATDIEVQGWVLKLAAHATENEDTQPVLDKITKLRVMIIDENNPVTTAEFRQLQKRISKDDFESLGSVRDGNEQIEFYLREKKDLITDVVMLLQSPDSFILLSLEGNLKMEDLQNLDFDFEGSEYLDHLKKKKNKKNIPRA